MCMFIFSIDGIPGDYMHVILPSLSLVHENADEMKNLGLMCTLVDSLFMTLMPQEIEMLLLGFAGKT